MNSVLSWLVVLLVLTLPAIAQEIGTLTLVEGSLRLIRGATVMKGTEGVRLRVGDIIESSSPGFVQLEFGGGAIVALGGSTRVYLLSHAAGRNGKAAELVLLSGWLKGQSGSTAGAYHYNCPILAAATKDGTLVVHCLEEAAELFVESGSAQVSEISPGGIGHAPRLLKAGQFCSRLARREITVAARPSSPFVQSMPRPFQDTFTSLLPRFTGKPPQPQRDHEVTYSEIQPWLSIPQQWRRGFVTRFQGRLDDAAFRKALDAHLKDYPEWGPVVHPEQYQPKISPAATGNPGTNGRNPN